MSRLSERFADDEIFRNKLLQHLRTAVERSNDEPASARRHLWYPLAEAAPEELLFEARANAARRWSVLGALVDVPKYVEDAKEDLAHLQRRLVGREAEVYAELDRLRAEYSFRMGLVIPLAFLSMVLSVRIGGPWILGVVAAVGLIYLGVGSATQADLQLVALLSAHRIASPAVDRLKTVDIDLYPYDQMCMDDDREQDRGVPELKKVSNSQGGSASDRPDG